ncbi:hypothetical protein CBS101457_006084 [Exobasidium rhododendri]|nr:hypothetical protein CBS101457_006084 [Exobasidium rhododendri]
MSCPFAQFARLTSFGGEETSKADSTFSSTSKLTTRLKDGTAEAHHEIEKSAGVRALMGSFHAKSSITLDRIDHFRFLVMLACVYIAMEAVLVQNDNALSDMTDLLVRSGALLEDIQVHLDEILDTTDAQPSDLDCMVEEGAGDLNHKIARRVLLAQEDLASRGLLGARRLTNDHVEILTLRQAQAVLRYIDQLSACNSSSSSRHLHYDEGISFTPLGTPIGPSSLSTLSANSFDLKPGSSSKATSNNSLILAHAYVRYMGDLSGGQHIVKRLSRLFPIYQEKGRREPSSKSGFEFYSFTSTRKTSAQLKEMIRSRMDGNAHYREDDIVSIVDEASEAFRLNRGLLDSLVDEEDLVDSVLQERPVHRLTRSSVFFPSLLLSPLLSFHSHTLAFIATLFALGTALTLYAVVH